MPVEIGVLERESAEQEGQEQEERDQSGIRDPTQP
jgi:hypothetical protein